MTEEELIKKTPYQETTNNIKVSVVPAHLEDSTDLTKGIYAFSYTIRLENLGGETVQLLERYWRISSGESKVSEVVGPGVSGENPVLRPNESYQYQSNAVINEPFGAMEGVYTFRSEGGKFFQVSIPSFDLIYPELYH